MNIFVRMNIVELYFMSKIRGVWCVFVEMRDIKSYFENVINVYVNIF